MAKNGKQLSPQEKAVADSKRKAEKAAKFSELASARVSKLLAQIENVQRLSNRNSYVYTEEQVGKIMKALQEAFRGLEASFKSSTGAAKTSFTV
jgi:Mg/Co/Ni transporter MgtE